MSTKTHGSLETADREVESPTNHQPAHRTLKLTTATPVACDGATVIFCDSFESTPLGQRYAGDVPLFILGASNPDATSSKLANANYHPQNIEQALKRGHWLHEEYPEHARETIAYAESKANGGHR
ncbi:hypothetical protein [Halococcus sp. IIIV-5B]|uniref:hypothetical protein n=1 Tax=Halococcus sp. IIIV-5B TaxID=2321230 RepID=UPI0011C3CD8D|nr:hypothetical protein [Halococcus sp. IIIV-5B]